MKSLITFLVALCLGIGVWVNGGSHQQVFALNLQSRLAIAQANPSKVVLAPSLQSTVTEELHHIPQGFYATFDIDALKAKIEQQSVFLIDVREPSEYSSGHIPGAVNIPLRQLGDRLDQIPSDQPVILYCSTGYRTGMGVLTLHLLGYDNVQGFPPSYQGWKQAEAQ